MFRSCTLRHTLIGHGAQCASHLWDLSRLLSSGERTGPATAARSASPAAPPSSPSGPIDVAKDDRKLDAYRGRSASGGIGNDTAAAKAEG